MYNGKHRSAAYGIHTLDTCVVFTFGRKRLSFVATTFGNVKNENGGTSRVSRRVVVLKYARRKSLLNDNRNVKQGRQISRYDFPFGQAPPPPPWARSLVHRRKSPRNPRGWTVTTTRIDTDDEKKKRRINLKVVIVILTPTGNNL